MHGALGFLIPYYHHHSLPTFFPLLQLFVIQLIHSWHCNLANTRTHTHIYRIKKKLCQLLFDIPKIHQSKLNPQSKTNYRWMANICLPVNSTLYKIITSLDHSPVHKKSSFIPGTWQTIGIYIKRKVLIKGANKKNPLKNFFSSLFSSKITPAIEHKYFANIQPGMW